MMKRPEQPEHDQIKPIICRSFAQIRFYCLVVFLCSDPNIKTHCSMLFLYIVCVVSSKRNYLNI